MALGDETMVRGRPRSSLLDLKPLVTHVPDVAGEVPSDIATMDAMLPLPGPGDAYKAHARPDNKALLTLCFVCKNSAVEGFAYADLRRIRFLPSEKQGGGPVLVLRFVESVITDVTIEGRYLDTLHNYLGYHRLAWLRELPPGKMLADKLATVITSIMIEQVEG